MEWDQQQREVIDAPCEARLLINAGPGTGKTAVACARVSQLIDQDGLMPSNILLISFTRTAIGEIRDRIFSHLNDEIAAYSVRIDTLDSLAWKIHSGFDEGAKIHGSYERNIEHTIKLVEQSEGVAEYFESIEHLVVDEAQDVFGIRADLVIKIIRKLHADCGVTVFADEAQAIYDFANDDEMRSGETDKESLLSERIRNGAAGTFQEYELLQVHRTDSPRLLKIFSSTRQKVLAAESEVEDKFNKVKDEITEFAHGEVLRVSDQAALTDLDEDTVILHRRRCEVLLTSSFLTERGVQHRVRMSGLPVCLVPWIGATLSEYGELDLSRDGFMGLWDEIVRGTPLATCGADDAWEQLVRIAGHSGIVSMRSLRQHLGHRVPAGELCHAELGFRGPIVSTIHAFKGREADTVYLMLPQGDTQSINQDEEARVMFVGATRGRKQLLIGPSYGRHFAKRVDNSGRVYCFARYRKGKAQIEIGCEADIVAKGLAGRRFFESPNVVRANQAQIRSFADKTVPLVAASDSNVSFRYRLRDESKADEDRCLAVLSKEVNNDLFDIADGIQRKNSGGKRRPPDTIQHLYVRGVRTIVLPPNAPESAELHEPWKSTGIMLAPLVSGYSMVPFPFRSGKWR